MSARERRADDERPDPRRPGWRDDRLAGWVPPTWEEVVEQHSARVYRLAYRLTGNVHDAEDLTQDVFVRVFRSLHTYQPGTFEGWLHRITTNVFLDKMRRKQRIRFDALSDDAAARLPSRGAGPEQHFTTPTSTTTCSGRSTRCRPTSAPPSCSATSRACPTRRSPRPSASSSAPCARASTAAAPSCARRSRTAPRSRSHDDPLASRPARVRHRAGCAGDPVTHRGVLRAHGSHLGALVSAYVDRDLPAGVLHACDQHLAVCGCCRAAAEDERRLLESMRRTTTPCPSSSLQSALLGLADTRPRSVTGLSCPWWSPVRPHCTGRRYGQRSWPVWRRVRPPRRPSASGWPAPAAPGSRRHRRLAGCPSLPRPSARPSGRRHH